MTQLSDTDWMRLAIELSWRCPPSESAYCVGAVLVDATGEEIARGYSRQTGPREHAEEVAIAAAHVDPRLREATLYSTLEPCSQRASKPRPCTQLIIDAAIPRVVIAWREPSLFVADCQGCELLAAAGITVVELPQLAEEAQQPNRHLLG